MIIWQLIILASVDAYIIFKGITVVEDTVSFFIHKTKVIADSIETALKLRFIPIEARRKGNLLHIYRKEIDRIISTGSITIEQSACRNIISSRPYSERDSFLVYSISIFRHRYVKYRIPVHPFTPPEVRPLVIYFWERKNIMSTGKDTKMAAAEKTGQDPDISVA